MRKLAFELEEITVTPKEISLYFPPIVWKGDSVGHVGVNDLFFWVMEGECFLSIDSENYIVRPGQLAYLPKGKMRTYTHVSERFCMYEMAFSAKAGEQNLMSVLGLDERNFVVDIPDIQAMTELFENSNLIEYAKNPMHHLECCSNALKIIKIYANERYKINDDNSLAFKPVLDYMTNNIKRSITIDDLASLVYMKPTYFIKKFKETFAMPPLAYLNRMRMYKAMGMLAGTTLSIMEIAQQTGFSDVSYFARVFKKHCKVTPGEYRSEFKHIYPHRHL